MKTYSVHKIYIYIFGIALLFFGYSTVREIIDPRYQMPNMFVPRAVFWYVVIYFWYEFLTVAYKVEFLGDELIRTTSLLKKTLINMNNIRAIKDMRTHVTVIHDNATTRISALIDGVGNIKDLLVAAPAKTAEERAEEGKKKLITTRRLVTILVGLILIAIAVYIEIQQIELRKGRI